MSFKDRSCSPVLLESGLKSFLGAAHNFPLINGLTWPRDSYGYINMSVGDTSGGSTGTLGSSSRGEEERYQEPAGSNQPAWSGYSRQWGGHYLEHSHPLPPQKRYIHPGNSKPVHSHGHGPVKEVPSSVLAGAPPEDKSKEDSELWCNVEAQTAFLGPNLWDKTYETDLKYVDLDEFLSENGVSMDGAPLAGLGPSAHGLPKRERSPSPSDCMSPDTLNPPSPADSTLSMASSGRDFDPRTRAFSDEELKPQPMIKKSRKQFVPDNLKDDKYWARRRKNNMAAKRSRDARRMKENQIALRAGYLEKENLGLRQELERLKKENLLLLDKLSKCADV